MSNQLKQPQDVAQEQRLAKQVDINPRRKPRRKGRKPKPASGSCDQFEEYFKSKRCEICAEMHQEDELMLCDRCDDSYHLGCLKPPLAELPAEEWICLVCINQIQQFELKKRGETQPQKETHCYQCKEELERRQLIKGRDKQGNILDIQFKSLIDLTCLYCKHSFHNVCFSERKNSLNCHSCEHIIRSKGPKSHDQFMKYIERAIQSLTLSDFYAVQHNPTEQNKTTHTHFKLKIPNYMSSWQFIVQYEASLFYSFETKGLAFIDQQIYQQSQKELMALNNPKRDTQGEILRLHPKDERAYEEFKINSKKGFVGPFQIKEDRIKGFYLTATDYIEPHTIISEYVGEVMTSRQALNQLQNDSIFSLLRGARAVESLDIVPQNYGNSSRFFAGLNNSLKKQVKQKMENVKALRFSYKGRVRILLHTSKPVQAGETLYFDYNGSGFQEYPTDHFVH